MNPVWALGFGFDGCHDLRRPSSNLLGLPLSFERSMGQLEVMAILERLPHGGLVSLT